MGSKLGEPLLEQFFGKKLPTDHLFDRLMRAAKKERIDGSKPPIFVHFIYDAPNSVLGGTLQYALNIELGNKDFVKFDIFKSIFQKHIEKGENVDELDEKGQTPLHIALAHNAHQTAQLLLNLGAVLTKINPREQALLTQKVSPQWQEIFKAHYLKLLEYKKPRNLKEIVAKSISEKGGFKNEQCLKILPQELLLFLRETPHREFERKYFNPKNLDYFEENLDLTEELSHLNISP